MPFCQPYRTFSLAFGCSSWTRLANVNIWVKFLSRNSEVFKIYTNYLSCLVYNQVYNLFVCTLCPCLTSFPQWNWDMQTTTKFPLARQVTAEVTCQVKGPFFVLDLIALPKHCWVVKKNRVLGVPDNLQEISIFFLPCSFTDLRPVIPERF